MRTMRDPLQSQHPVTSMDTLLVRGSHVATTTVSGAGTSVPLSVQLGSGLAGDGLITENGSVAHSPCPDHQLVSCKLALAMGACHLPLQELNQAPLQLLTFNPHERSSGRRAEMVEGSALCPRRDRSSVGYIFSGDEFLSPVLVSPQI